jgi:protocatechuate 3,4-dioxygenase beta subunit
MAAATILALVLEGLRTADERARRSERAQRERTLLERGLRRPAPPARSVRVLDAVTREPVAGAVVVSRCWRNEFEYEETRLHTDAGGTCAIVGDSDGIHVSARGYATARWQPEPSESIELLLERAPEVVLAVEDATGDPLAQATASLVPAPEIRFEADEAGRIRVAAKDDLQVAAPGHATKVVAAKSARVVLWEGFTAGGRVVDSTGAPLAGAEVRVDQPAGCCSRSEYEPTARTDSEGRFRVGGLSSGELGVFVRAPGFCPVRVGAWTGEARLEVCLFRSASIRVRIVLPSGQLATGAKLFHLPAAQPGAEEFWTEPYSEEEATHYLEPLQPGEHGLGARLGDLGAGQTVVLAEGEHRDVLLVLGPARPADGSYFRVRVLDPLGHPVEGATVARHGRTDEAGLALVKTIQEVGFDLEVRVTPPPRLAKDATGATLRIRTVATPEEAEVVDVRLERPAAFELEVVDARGDPVPLRSLSFFNEHSVKVGDLRWMVHPDYPSTVHLRPREETLAPRFLFDREPGRHRVVMYPHSVITGRLVDEADRPVTGPNIVRPPGGRDHTIVSDAAGRFRIEGQYAGRHEFLVGRGRVPEALIRAHVLPGEDFDAGDVVLRPPRQLTGRILDRHGHPLGGARIAARPYVDGRNWAFTTSHADGFYSMRVAPMTRYLFIHKNGHGLRVAPIDAALEVALPAPGRLEIEYGDEEFRIGWPQPDGTVLWGEWFSGWYPYDEFAPGRLIVEQRTTGGAVQRSEVTIVAAETTRVRAE